jgi:hypothetical protein
MEKLRFTDGVHLGARIELQWGERFTSEDYLTMYGEIDDRILDGRTDYKTEPLDGGLVLETCFERGEVDCDGMSPDRVYVIIREVDHLNEDGTENQDKQIVCSVRLRG